MPETRNTIYNYFKNFAQSHLQLSDFGYGDLSEISASDATTYPLMWVVPAPVPINGVEIDHTYSILIADRIFKDLENLVEVESDTFQICQDLLADLYSRTEFTIVDTSINLQPFIHRFKDEVNGWIFDISLRVNFNYDSCQIPISNPVPGPGDNCAPSTLFVNSVFLATIESGGSLNLSVRYQNGTAVGTVSGGVVLIPNPTVCSPVTIQVNEGLFDTADAGETVNIVVKNTADQQVGSIVAGEVIVPDVTIQLNSIDVDSEPSGSNANILIENTATQAVGTVDGEGHMTIGDSSLTVNGTAFTDIPAEQPYNLLVKDTNGTQVGSKVGSEWIVPAGSTPSGIVYQGQYRDRAYTSYDTNGYDDGGRVQSGFYGVTWPATPLAYAELDYSVGAAYWFTLKNNNVFGNKYRFTDVLGTQVFSATGNKDSVVIDHLTGFMWNRNIGAGAIARSGTKNWQAWIDTAAAFSIVVNTVTYDDWYIPSDFELSMFFGEINSTNLTNGTTTYFSPVSGDVPTTTTVPTSTSLFRAIGTTCQPVQRSKATNGETTDLIIFRKHLW